MEFWSQKIQISIFGVESFWIIDSNNCDTMCWFWSDENPRYRLDIVKNSSLSWSKVMFMAWCHGRHVGGGCGQLKVETKLFLWFVFVILDWSGISKHRANIMPATIEVHDQAWICFLHCWILWGSLYKISWDWAEPSNIKMQEVTFSNSQTESLS